jgi:tRNA threonylcarbamoyladenosine biosynthesis protein TsaE
MLVTKETIQTLALTVLDRARNSVMNGAVTIALHGDLGAGKTTFVQTLGAVLFINETITSPTFTIMKTYETKDADFPTFVHMDAYRIDTLAELGPLHIVEIFQANKTLFCIEWAEKIREVLPKNTIDITFEIKDEDTRIVHIK